MRDLSEIEISDCLTDDEYCVCGDCSCLHCLGACLNANCDCKSYDPRKK
jgi:hypothetical protein